MEKTIFGDPVIGGETTAFGDPVLSRSETGLAITETPEYLADLAETRARIAQPPLTQQLGMFSPELGVEQPIPGPVPAEQPLVDPTPLVGSRGPILGALTAAVPQLNPYIDALQRGSAEAVKGATMPSTLVQAPAFAVPYLGQALALKLGTEALSGAAGTIAGASPENDFSRAGPRIITALEQAPKAALGAGMLYGGGAGTLSRPPSGLFEGQIPPSAKPAVPTPVSVIPELGPPGYSQFRQAAELRQRLLQPENQLAEYVPTTTTRYQVAPSEAVSPYGALPPSPNVQDITQLSPAELREFQREAQARMTAQERQAADITAKTRQAVDIPLVGGFTIPLRTIEQLRAELSGQTTPTLLPQIVAPTGPVGTPAERPGGGPAVGGQVSFAGQGVPSARQAAEFPKVGGEQEELMQQQFVPAIEKGGEISASRIRSNKGQVPQYAGQEGEAEVQREGREAYSGENLQQPPSQQPEPVGAREVIEGGETIAEKTKEEILPQGAVGQKTPAEAVTPPGNIIAVETAAPPDAPAKRVGEIIARLSDPNLTAEERTSLRNELINLRKPAAKKGIKPTINPRGGEAGATTMHQVVAETVKKVAKFFKTPPNNVVPALKFDRTSVLPALQDKAIANRVFSQPFGVERIPGLARAFGGKGRISNARDAALATWYAEDNGIGPAVASAVGELHRSEINAAFKSDDQGNLNVGAPTGASRKIADVFNGLRQGVRYTLTPEQQRVWNNVIKPIQDRKQEFVRQYNLGQNLGRYFERPVTKSPAGGSPRQADVIPTEQEGWQQGYEYSTDVAERLIHGVKRIYGAMADKRLINDPALGASTRTGAMVLQPGFLGRRFDEETAKVLNKEFAGQQNSFRRRVATVNSMLKGLELGFDFGVGQLQLLPSFFSNPRIWGESQYRGLVNMIHPTSFSEYVKQNRDAVLELAQMGSGVGQLQEMLAGIEKGQPLTRVPVVGSMARAFGRQFQGALDTAKIEFWKAFRETTPPEEWPKVVQQIETLLGSARMESAMVPRGRVLLERVALLAPSYYRSAFNFVASLTDKGVTGSAARRSMGAFAVGSVALFYGVAKWLGMDDEEIKKRLNPANPTFMLWKIDVGNGRQINIGPGGVFRGFLRLMGNVVKTSVEHPENWKALTADKNPIMRWLRGHAAPIPSAAFDVFTGRDFLGRESDVTSLPRKVLPLGAEEFIRPEGEPPASKLEVAGQMLGATQFPVRPTKQERTKKVAERLYPGKEDLSRGKRQRVQKQVVKEPVSTSLQERERIAGYATKHSFERLYDLQKELSPTIVTWLEKNKLQLRSYDLILEGGAPMTEKEQKVYPRLIKEEYERLLLPPANRGQVVKQDFVDNRLKMARARAQSRLKKETK